MATVHTILEAKRIAFKNRLVYPPVCIRKASEEGEITQEILDYYDEKTRGGHFAVAITEHCFISQRGKTSAGQISVAEDTAIEKLAELAMTIRKNGTWAVLQINHAGSNSDPGVVEEALLGPSAVPNPRSGATPEEMTEADIAEVVAAFAQAARRAKAAGFDGVELHSAHSYLLNQFYSPLCNKRQDGYGGELENRVRLHREVIAAVRAEVGPDFPIFLRLGACDHIEGGSTIEDGVKAAKIFEEAGVDLLDISGGACGYVNPENEDPGYFGAEAKAIKEAVQIPVILTGGVKEPMDVENLLNGGKADLIGVGRAVMNDSEWAAKALAALQEMPEPTPDPTPTPEPMPTPMTDQTPTSTLMADQIPTSTPMADPMPTPTPTPDLTPTPTPDSPEGKVRFIDKVKGLEKKYKIMVIAGLAVAFILIFTIAMIALGNARDYSEAEKLAEEAKFDQAIEVLQPLVDKDYKDSATLKKYILALKALDKGETASDTVSYKDAETAFAALGDFKDSKDYLAYANASEDLRTGGIIQVSSFKTTAEAFEKVSDIKNAALLSDFFNNLADGKYDDAIASAQEYRKAGGKILTTNEISSISTAYYTSMDKNTESEKVNRRLGLLHVSTTLDPSIFSSLQTGSTTEAVNSFKIQGLGSEANGKALVITNRKTYKTKANYSISLAYTSLFGKDRFPETLGEVQYVVRLYEKDTFKTWFVGGGKRVPGVTQTLQAELYDVKTKKVIAKTKVRKGPALKTRYTYSGSPPSVVKPTWSQKANVEKTLIKQLIKKIP